MSLGSLGSSPTLSFFVREGFGALPRQENENFDLWSAPNEKLFQNAAVNIVDFCPVDDIEKFFDVRRA